MDNFTIEIYCFVNDLLLKIDDKSLNKRRKLTNSQTIATVIISSKYFYGNQVLVCVYLKSHHGFDIPDKSNFNRVLLSLTDLLANLFFALGIIFKKSQS